MRLIRSFPIEMGEERTVIFNKKQLLEYIYSNNINRNIYFSIYTSKKLNEKGRLDFSEAIIDKLFFDFDGSEAFENVMKLHRYCESKRIKHAVLFSGNKGFHIYIFTKVFCPKNKEVAKRAILNSQLFLKNKLNLCCDTAVFGDVSRLGRLYNTIHPKSKKYCIPLSSNDLLEGEDFIREKANDSNKDSNCIFGDYVIDLSRNLNPVSNNNYSTENDLNSRVNLLTFVSSLERDLNDYVINDNLLQYVLNNTLDKNMQRNNIVFKNLAVLLVQSGMDKESIYNIAEKIVKNCPGHNLREFFGWVNKAKTGEILNFNKNEINKWIKDYNINIDLYEEELLA